MSGTVGYDQEINKTVCIDAPVSRVWAAVTDPMLMKQWMSETEIEIISERRVGGPFIISAPWYKTHFENKGSLLAYEVEQTFSYSHLSSLSRLPDSPENYTILGFRLTAEDNGTSVTLTLSNFPTEAIYRHFAFYWNVALELLKRFAEEGHETDK